MQIVAVPAPSAPARPRLIGLLDEASRWGLLRARAGYDKSLTVRAWLHADPHRLASARWVQPAPGSDIDAARIGAVLAGERRVRTLVLDATATDRRLDHGTLTALGGLARRVIVVALSDVVLPDHLPLLLDTALLDAEALAYTPEELLALAPGIGAERARHIHEATGGWPALSRLLLANEAETGPDRDRIVADFAADVFTGLTPLAAGVLRAGCVAAAPTAALTAALSGLDEEQAIVGWDEIVREGLASVSGIGEDRRWRVVPILREAHLARLREQQPEEMRALDRRAAGWFVEHPGGREAIEHAVAAEEWGTAADMIATHALSLFADEPGTIRSLLRRIPAEAIEDRPAARMLLDVFLENGDEARFTAVGSASRKPGDDSIAAVFERRDPRDGDVVVGWREGVRRRHAGDLAGALAVRELIRARLADTATPLRAPVRQYDSILHLQNGITAMLAGRFVDAEQDFIEATADKSSGLGLFAQRNAFGDLALVAATEGDLPRAAEHLRQMGERPRIRGFWARLVRFGELVAEALVAAERLALDDARSVLEEAARSADRDELWPFYLLARSRLAVAEGGALAALAEIASLRRARIHLAPVGSTASILLPLAEAEALLAVDRAAQAGTVLEAAPTHPLLGGMRVLQRVQLGGFEEAIALAGGVVWADEAGPASRALACLARAVAELRCGRSEDALLSFRLAHSLVVRFDLRRTPALLPRAELAELEGLSGLALGLEGVAALLPALVAPVSLTGREQVVLQHLAGGETIGMIARALFVSENTVRTQLRTVYRKLGVNSREDAVAEARRRGVVD